MKSILEILPTEIWFEIFEYLTIYDIFYGFIHLNQRINNLVNLYPLKLDFQQISRSKFDFICRSIQSKQIISLFLSDELMPNQVQLFYQYFPNFHNEFINLKILKYIDTSTILPNLPSYLTSLSIKTYFKTKQTDSIIIQILQYKSQSLKSLQIDGSYIFRSINYSFPFLTHLIIDYCTIGEFHRILYSLKSSLIYLKVFLDEKTDEKEKITLIPQFKQLSKTLLNLILTFSEAIVVSFDLIIQWIKELYQLISLTIETTCTLNMMNGQLWENYLCQTKIKNFNFKFILVNQIIYDQDHDLLLQSFRSSFWMNKQHYWYVVCEKGQLKSSRPIIYSIPYFQSKCIFHPSNNTQLKSINKNDRFISKQRIYLILTFYRTIFSPNLYFNNVYSLALIAINLPSIEILQSIVNLKYIERFDVSLVRNLSIDQFQILINSMINLKIIRMQYNPFYIPPLHIYSYIFVRDDQNISVINYDNIERFLHLFFHIQYLEITIQTKDIVIELLNRLHYLEIVRIYSYQNYLENIRYHWLIENIPRLKTIDFTYRVTSTCLILSIGNRKLINNQTIERNTKRRAVKSSWLKSCSPCKLQ